MSVTEPDHRLPGRRKLRSHLLATGVGMALADSSLVTLALPDIVREFDVGITRVAWVLISYNVVLAACAVPAAHVTRRRPRLFCAAGLTVFAAASLACGLAGSFGVLVGARCVQAVGASGVVATVLVLLGAVEGSEARAVRPWTRAGVLGAALGPAIGGILTQVAGWQAIFLVQVPVALLPLLALPRLRVPPQPELAQPARRPHIPANLALLLGSAALSAALFLLVILLVNGWSLDPVVAGVVVTVMPIAAITAARVAGHLGSRVVRVVAGFVLLAGGLAALGLLPDAGWAWTVPPQLLVGAGLGLTVTALTEQAIGGRQQAIHGGWTIASRHAGIVIGLLALTPVFTHELTHNQAEATRAGAAIVLDSQIEPLRKISVARDVLRTVDEADGRLPDVRPAFDAHAGGSDESELRRVGAALQEQLERAVTKAFGPPFLLAALFALAALVPVALTRDVDL